MLTFALSQSLYSFEPQTFPKYGYYTWSFADLNHHWHLSRHSKRICGCRWWIDHRSGTRLPSSVYTNASSRNEPCCVAFACRIFSRLQLSQSRKHQHDVCPDYWSLLYYRQLLWQQIRAQTPGIQGEICLRFVYALRRYTYVVDLGDQMATGVISS